MAKLSDRELKALRPIADGPVEDPNLGDLYVLRDLKQKGLLRTTTEDCPDGCCEVDTYHLTAKGRRAIR